MRNSESISLGIEPKWYFLEKRYNELSGAVERYVQKGLRNNECVQEWKVEMEEIVSTQLKDGRHLKWYDFSNRWVFEKEK